MNWARFSAVLAALMFACFGALTMANAAPSKPIRLGPSVFALDGPWRFSIGDNRAWANPNFNDAQWETVALAPSAGAHDPEVGRKGYVPGWSARGHKGYAGFAWYRLRVALDTADAAPLAIAGPPIVDGAYQLFVDGKLLGGSGAFPDGRAPVVHGARPLLFELPSNVAARRKLVVALRVWTPAELAVGDGGGVHAAPVIGRLDGVAAAYQGQRLQSFKDHVADAALPLAFAVLALIAIALLVARPADPAYPWISAALILTALTRANQIFLFWTGAETLQAYEVLRDVILAPLSLACWILAWRYWFGAAGPRGFNVAFAGILAGVTGLCMAAAFGALPWLAPDSPAHGMFWQTALGLRLALAALYCLVLGEGLWRERSMAALAACGVALLAAIGLFAGELTRIGLKVIWFPFGVGVTRTQFAYAALVVALFALILRRFTDLAREPAPRIAEPDLWGQPPPNQATFTPKAATWSREKKHPIHDSRAA